MRAAQLVATGVVELREVATPEPGPGEVLVRVAAAGLSGADVHLVQAKEPVFSLPMTLGHETAGRVERLGPGVKRLQPGQAVLVSGTWGCGRCRPCAEGRENACEYWATRSPVPRGPGMGFDGGLAEWMVAPASALYPLGDLDPVEAAPLADAGAAPCHAINLVRAHLKADATVVVIGAGGLGHLALQLLRATTACRIIAVEAEPLRLAAARSFGADELVASDSNALPSILEFTNGLGAEVVFDFVGLSKTLALGNAAVANYGALVVSGLGQGWFSLVADSPPIGKPKWGTTLLRPYGATNRDLVEVIGLAQRGKLKAVVERRSLGDALAVLGELAKGEARGRVVLVP